MITCKEDLINTYIKNDHGELRELYLSACNKFGLHSYVGDNSDFNSEFYVESFILCNEFSLPDSEGVLQDSNFSSGKEITILDLKPRTKPSYEKVEYANKGDLLFVKNDDEYTECLVIGWHPHHPAIVIETGEMIGTATLDDLHRKVEKPIEWWEDAAEFANNSDDMLVQYNKEDDSISMLGTFSRNDACDFARILLEQGE